MILNHLLGIYTHPREEWATIDKKHENCVYALSHILVIALIPSLVTYYSATQLGWKIGAGDTIRLTEQSAFIVSIGLYVGLFLGVLALAFMIRELAGIFDAKPTYTQSLELAAYTATPLFMVGFAGLYPQLWFVMSVGLVGLSYSVYLLYAGVPIIMHIPEEKGFIYASSVVTCGLVLLSVLMAATIIAWGSGFGPQFLH
ncbi:Yip1 family protein [Salinimonas iocasae]|uniref:YIP1 family protein n=1 Tax=Salinimonas iocasae TaxID=2572577 RepID=A0A5B7YBQ4_9ALTE|nr:Yip1 family protein [Salinimonas iocasae]QCZ93167.1 YIP1 family protein [Salinimonas iocasae]